MEHDRARSCSTDPGAAGSARELVDSYLAEVDDAANRFRERLRDPPARPRSGEVTTVSPTLADLVAEAPRRRRPHRRRRRPHRRRRAAPARLRPGPAVWSSRTAAPVRAVVRPAPGYRRVRLVRRRLRLPAGVELDLGATAKAVAADRAAGPRARPARRRGAREPRRRHRHRRTRTARRLAGAGSRTPTTPRGRVRACRRAPRSRPPAPARDGGGAAARRSTTSSTHARAGRPDVLAQRHRGRRLLPARQRGDDRLARARREGPTTGSAASAAMARLVRHDGVLLHHRTAGRTGKRHESRRPVVPRSRHRRRGPRRLHRDPRARDHHPLGTRGARRRPLRVAELHRTASLVGVGLDRRPRRHPALRPLGAAQARRRRAAVHGRVPAALAGARHPGRRPARAHHRAAACCGTGSGRACSTRCTGRPTRCGPWRCCTPSAPAPTRRPRGSVPSPSPASAPCLLALGWRTSAALRRARHGSAGPGW